MSSPDASEIKCIITSLLTSNPRKATIQQLCADFVNTEGYKIPFQRLGFTSVEEYLRSIPDTVRIYGAGPSAEVQGIIKPKSAHINLLVAKQKKSNIPAHKRKHINNYSGGYGQYRPSPSPSWHHPLPWQHYPPWHHEPPFSPSPTFDFGASSKSYMRQSPTSSVSPEANIQNKQQNCPIPVQFKSNSHPQWDPNRELPHTEINVKQSYAVTFQHDLTTDTDKAIQRYSTLMPESSTVSEASATNSVSTDRPIDTKQNIEDNLTEASSINEQCLHDEGNEAESSEYESESVSQVSVKIQNNLKKLILQFPNGIWCTKLPTEYRNMFKKKISFEKYNYRSLIEMCSDLPQIFHYVKVGSDDFMLYDKTKPIPSLDHNENKTQCVQVENIVKTHILDELPKLNWSSCQALIPLDVLQISDEIPRFFPADLEVGDILDISIGEIYDISKFWIYLTFGELESLMKDLQNFFCDEKNLHVIPETLLEEGLFCVAMYLGQYHRCVIVKLLPKIPGSTRVFFVDYGTVDNVCTNKIWFLPKQFGKIPCQAMRTRLSNIYPPYENDPWSADAVVRFEQLITNRVVVAKVTNIDEKEHILEVYLADITNRNQIFYINDLLVKEGYAVYSDQEQKKSFVDYDCMPIVRYIYLRPEFYEIECGLAPTIEEMKYIVANNIPLHHYMPQYFDIYFEENVDAVQKQHETFNKKRLTNTPIPESPVEDDFDFSFFPECLLGEIKELLQQEESDFASKARSEQVRLKSQTVSKGEPSGENKPDKQVKQYFCNKKRISELIHGSTSKTDKSDSNRYRESLSPLDTSKSISDISYSWDNSDDVVQLNNSFKQISLNNSDSAVLKNVFKPHKPTNPFHSDYLNDTNPFRATNPFLSDIEDTVNKSELFEMFSKYPEDKLSEKIFNNLNDSNPSSCKMSKQVNIDRSNLSNNSANISSPNSLSNISGKSGTVVNPSKPLEKSEMRSPGVAVSHRVRTPPGFSSENLQNRTCYNYYNNYVPNTFSNNPYYQRFQYSQYNSTFYPQNQLNMSLTQPIAGNYYNYVPQYYPNQFSFNVPNWQQTFPQQNYYNQPQDPKMNYN